MNKLGNWVYILGFAKDGKTIWLSIRDNNGVETIPLEILPDYSTDISFKLRYASVAKLFATISDLDSKNKKRVSLFIKDYFQKRAQQYYTTRSLQESGFGEF